MHTVRRFGNFWRLAGTLGTLLVTSCVVIIRCTEPFWSPCICTLYHTPYCAQTFQMLSCQFSLPHLWYISHSIHVFHTLRSSQPSVLYHFNNIRSRTNHEHPPHCGAALPILSFLSLHWSPYLSLIVIIRCTQTFDHPVHIYIPYIYTHNQSINEAMMSSALLRVDQQ
jgi:hypothetical protein